MADKNIQMTQRNATNDAWDNLYPKTKAENVIAADGTTTFETHLADYVRQPGYINPTAGTSTAYTGSTTPALTAYAEGVAMVLVPHVNCGASPTFNWDGKGAVALKKKDGTAYAAGELLAGKPYPFRKVGTDFISEGEGGGNKLDLLPRFLQLSTVATAVTQRLSVTGSGYITSIVNPTQSDIRAVKLSIDGTQLVPTTGTSMALMYGFSVSLMHRFTTGFIFYSDIDSVIISYILD